MKWPLPLSSPHDNSTLWKNENSSALQRQTRPPKANKLKSTPSWASMRWVSLLPSWGLVRDWACSLLPSCSQWTMCVLPIAPAHLNPALSFPLPLPPHFAFWDPSLTSLRAYRNQD